MIVCCMSSAKLKTACPTVTRSLSRPFSSKNILGHVRKTWEIFVADHSCFTVIANRVQTAYVSIFFVFIRRGCLFTSSLIGTMALSLNIPLSVVMDILLRHVSCRTVVRFLLLPIIWSGSSRNKNVSSLCDTLLWRSAGLWSWSQKFWFLELEWEPKPEDRVPVPQPCRSVSSHRVVKLLSNSTEETTKDLLAVLIPESYGLFQLTLKTTKLDILLKTLGV